MTCCITDVARARGALVNSPFQILRELEVEQNGEYLVISGKVNSFYEKQLAQEAIRAVCDDIDVFNTVAVRS